MHCEMAAQGLIANRRPAIELSVLKSCKHMFIYVASVYFLGRQRHAYNAQETEIRQEARRSIRLMALPTMLGRVAICGVAPCHRAAEAVKSLGNLTTVADHPLMFSITFHGDAPECSSVIFQSFFHSVIHVDR